MVSSGERESRSREARLASGEHGFRFFPGFYRHVVDTMQRIPFGKGNVADNPAHLRTAVGSLRSHGIVLPSRFPQRPQDIANLLDAFSVVSGDLGVPSTRPVFLS
jgi:uncharacterized protein with NAD-binding domain and iron-sulfur cluster